MSMRKGQSRRACSGAAREAFWAVVRIAEKNVPYTAYLREYRQRAAASLPTHNVVYDAVRLEPAHFPLLDLLVAVHGDNTQFEAAAQGQTWVNGAMGLLLREWLGGDPGVLRAHIRFQDTGETTLAGALHALAVCTGRGQAARELLDHIFPKWRETQAVLYEEGGPLYLTDPRLRHQPRWWVEVAEGELTHIPPLSQKAGLRLLRESLDLRMGERVPVALLRAVLQAGVRLDTPLPHGEGQGKPPRTVLALVQDAAPGSMQMLWANLLLRADLKPTRRAELTVPRI